MPLPNIFAAQTQPNLQMLDENFAALGALTPIHCTASGTNTVTLTPATDTPTISAYSDQMQFTAVAAGTNSTAVTAQVGSLGAKNVYKATTGGPIALTGSEIVSGSAMVLIYQDSLNSGSGGFLLANPVSAATSLSGQVQGTHKNLSIDVTSDTAISLTADAVCVSDGVAAYNTVRSVSLTFNTALAAGLLAMDTGSIGASTWYAVYVIYNPTTQAISGVLSASFSAPSQANTAGYTQYARVGAVRTEGANKLLRTLQKNDRAQYKVVAASVTPNLPIMITGASGNRTTPTWTAVSVSSFVPTTAGVIRVILASSNNTLNNAAIAAPNNSYGGIASFSNPPWLSVGATGNNGIAPHIFGEMVLESTNVYYAADAECSLACAGWVDNL